jgi:hypothetical protein
VGASHGNLPHVKNFGDQVTLTVGAMMGRLHTRGCIVVSVRCKDSPERGAWSPAGERRDAVAILVVSEAEERADGTGQACESSKVYRHTATPLRVK